MFIATGQSVISLMKSGFGGRLVVLIFLFGVAHHEALGDGFNFNVTG